MIPRSAIHVAALLYAVTIGQASSAYGQESKPLPYEVHPAADGGITLTAFAATWVWHFSDIDKTPWNYQLLPWDDTVKNNFSASAAKLADGTVTLTVALPLAIHMRAPFDETTARRALLYTEALALNALFTNSAKYLVQRPRPYTYSSNPLVQRYATREGDDAYLSFYSGHASNAFTAAVAGSYLYALESDDPTARAAVWGLQLTLATMTANLRVRAGKHFYSDVAVGALAGTAVGLAVPLLHQRDGVSYRPSGREWAAIGGGIVTGALISQLLPLKDDLLVPTNGGDTSITVVPLLLEGGGTGVGLLAISR